MVSTAAGPVPHPLSLSHTLTNPASAQTCQSGTCGQPYHQQKTVLGHRGSKPVSIMHLIFYFSLFSNLRQCLFILLLP